jgi:hypothetical protein
MHTVSALITCFMRRARADGPNKLTRVAIAGTLLHWAIRWVSCRMIAEALIHTAGPSDFPRSCNAY